MNPYLIIAFLVALLAAGAGGFKLGADYEVAAKAREDKHITEAVDAANATAAKAIADLKPRYTTIQGKLEKEIEIRTEYRDCKLSPGGMQLANQALDPRAEAPSGGNLPSADATAK